MNESPKWDPDDRASRRGSVVSQDPRFLIILFILVLVSTFLIRSTGGLLLVTAYIVALYVVSGLSFHSLSKGFRPLSLFLFLVIGVNGVLVDGEPIPVLPFFSREGLIAGVYYALRVVVLYAMLALFVSITSQESMASGLAGLVRPFSARFARRVAMHGFLSLGFLPLFRDEVERIRIAQGFRGGGMRGGLLRRAAGARMLIVPLFVSAIHRSGQLAMAVEIRRIEATIDRILVVERPGVGDFAFAGMTVVVIAAAVSL
jgi:energy-coupling factor transport system permease protein